MSLAGENRKGNEMKRNVLKKGQGLAEMEVSSRSELSLMRRNVGRPLVSDVLFCFLSEVPITIWAAR